MRGLAVMLMVGLSACATSGGEAGHLAYAAATPLRDINLVRDRVPEQLSALRDPYGYTAQNGCAGGRMKSASCRPPSPSVRASPWASAGTVPHMPVGGAMCAM